MPLSDRDTPSAHSLEGARKNNDAGAEKGLQLSLYERKCMLINREIDGMGMGRYQWEVWALCGFGYLLDLLWAQAFGLVLGPLQQEFGFGNGETGNISTSFSAGLTAGAFIWGFVSDLVGRRWAFNLTCLFSSVFGLCLGASDSYATFLVLTALVGFGVGGNVPIDTTIMLEFVPQDRRFLLAALSVFQPLGVVLCSAIAFAFIPLRSCSPNFSEPSPLPSCRASDLAPGMPCCSRADNMGWRYLLYTLGGITLLIFVLRFVVFKLYESPKCLIYNGQDASAVGVLHRIAKVNKRQCRLSLADLEALDTGNDLRELDSTHPLRDGERKEKGVLRLDRYRMLFSNWQMTRLTILVWLTYVMDFWGFTVAGFYFPRIVALKDNQAASRGLISIYASYIYTYTPGILGVLLGAAMYRVHSFGRKWIMCLSAGLMGASIFLFSAADTVAKNLGLFTMEYFFQSMFNAVLYGWTPEAFPAPVRGTACGVASFWGRLFGIVSPLIAQHLYASTGGNDTGEGNVNAVLYLAGGVTLGCVVSTALLPNKILKVTDG